MNKKRWFVIAAFTIGYAALLSIGMVCLWNLFLIALATMMFSEPTFKEYPRFIPFCYIVGLFALGGLVLLFLLDGKATEKFSFVKRICWSKFGVIIGLTVPLFMLWSALFRYLQRIF